MASFFFPFSFHHLLDLVESSNVTSSLESQRENVFPHFFTLFSSHFSLSEPSHHFLEAREGNVVFPRSIIITISLDDRERKRVRERERVRNRIERETMSIDRTME